MSSPPSRPLNDGIASVDSNIQQSEETMEPDGDEECGFCVFMKGGGCRESFIAWEDCVKESELKNEDTVEKCVDVTVALEKCMEAHSDYYDPILRAQKRIDVAADKVLESDHSAELPHQITNSTEGEGNLEEEEEGEGGFRMLMEDGECRDSFIAWQSCIREAELNGEKIFDKCVDVTATLRECMESHPDYNEPIL